MNESVTDTPPFQQTLQVVSFMARGYRFAVEASWVRSQQAATKNDTAIRAEQLLGLAAGQDSENKRILLIRHVPADYSILVSEPVTLSDLNLNDLHPLPEMLAARCALNGVRALATVNKGVTVLIDLGAIDPNLFSR